MPFAREPSGWDRCLYSRHLWLFVQITRRRLCFDNMQRVFGSLLVLLSVFRVSNCHHAEQRPSLAATAAKFRIEKKWEKFAHGGPLLSISFSPDGKKIASTGWDETVKVWDSSSGELLQTLREKLEVLCVAFSPDGRTLAYGGFDRKVHLFDDDKGARSLKGHADCVDSVAFSADGSMLGSGSWDGTVRLWDRLTGKLLHKLPHKNAVFTIAFSPDGRTLASTGPEIAVALWDTETAEQKGSLSRGASEHWSGNAIAFSPDGRVVAAETEGAVLLWDTGTGTLVRELQDEEMQHKWVTAIAFSPDGSRLANGIWGHKVKIWDLASGGLLTELEIDSMPVRSLAFSSDGRLLAVGGYTSLSVWELGK
ncbi:MAG: hypothetical protein C5B54_03405 [Acidobacteria bacterium]|nr:MAG: hypothetical protein C5B54_03405 [Acidobacteriota bacterium]